MDFERYRREMMRIEASPELAERTIEKILEEGRRPAASKATAMAKLPSTVVPRTRRPSDFPWRMAACLLTCLVLCAGIAVPLSIATSAEPAVARAPKNSMENIKLEEGATTLLKDAFVIDAEADLHILRSHEGTQRVSISLEDERFCLMGVEDDCLSRESLNFGAPFETELVEGEARFVIRMRLGLGDEVARRLTNETPETAAYRPYAILKTITEALSSTSLTLTDLETGERYEYSFDIERFKNQWDYENQLRKGGPATISLEREDENAEY